ncbi:MAG TPA: ADP-ribosylglycohydrolase family protein, partial [Burkholderiales bacterium]|nr:ADP-ribosylglycohydrolase family protein [Burkholderiales bacterium]
GGVYIAALYALAFVSDDVGAIAREALEAIPAGSRFRSVMSDVLRWHAEYPNDWHETWFRVEHKWGEDIGCPEGVFSPFDIDAKVNAAWVLIGLLYGGGDFGKTVDISARCGDDSDCNPASAAGILGTVLGWSRIPERWRTGLAAVERERFPYMDFSLLDACGFSFDQALAVVLKKGGRVSGDEIIINRGETRPVGLEVNFQGIRPTEKRELRMKPARETTIEFEGVGIVLGGEARRTADANVVVRAAFSIDGRVAETIELATDPRWRRDPLYWAYGLRPGKHSLTVKVLGPASGAELRLSSAVIYGPDKEPR